MSEPAQLAERLVAGDRRALAKAITLVESVRPVDRDAAAALIDSVMPRTGGATRVGVSGPPGVGKSTFIEAFGLHAIGEGRTVAVLAVDPSSTRSKGSILGDKTRMDALARDPHAYIRPSPSRGELGGVARRTREAILLCEAAGFDTVLVETVGVGQSEIEVDDMVDTLLLLLSPGGGDELQGMKRGVMELADVVAVTKADGDLLNAAQQAAADYRHALHLLRPRDAAWSPPVLLCSALKGEGIDAVWGAVLDHEAALRASGAFAERRAAQLLGWMWSELRDAIMRDVLGDDAVAAAASEVERQVAAGELSPVAAAGRLLALVRGPG